MDYKFDNRIELLEIFFINSTASVGFNITEYEGDFWHEDKTLKEENVKDILLHHNEQVWVHNQYYRVTQDPIIMQYCNSNQIIATYSVNHVAQQHLN